ncbi:MAG: HAD hydrolase-like protein, partial [Candidatus Bathyarchaeota archaeon]|nr:HAD hydrolase-like protein [Candidatus Bathyarchaeota archaeon]
DKIISAKNLFGKDKSIKRYLKHLNLEADKIIYVGDELRDIHACQKLAVRMISVTWGFDSLELLKTGKPDYIASKPKEIMEIIGAV